MGLIPGSGRSPGEGNSIPLQYSCLAIPWAEEPGSLQSIGRGRVGGGLGTKQQVFAMGKMKVGEPDNVLGPAWVLVTLWAETVRGPRVRGQAGKGGGKKKDSSATKAERHQTSKVVSVFEARFWVRGWQGVRSMHTICQTNLQASLKTVGEEEEDFLNFLLRKSGEMKIVHNLLLWIERCKQCLCFWLFFFNSAPYFISVITEMFVNTSLMAKFISLSCLGVWRSKKQSLGWQDSLLSTEGLEG